MAAAERASRSPRPSTWELTGLPAVPYDAVMWRIGLLALLILTGCQTGNQVKDGGGYWEEDIRD